MADSIFIIKKDALQSTYDELRALAALHGDSPVVEGTAAAVNDRLTSLDLDAYEKKTRPFVKKENHPFRLAVTTPSGAVAYLRDLADLQRAYEELRKRDEYENGDIDFDKGSTDLVLDLGAPLADKTDPTESGLAESGAVGFDRDVLARARNVVTDMSRAVFAIKTSMPATSGWSGTGYIFQKKLNDDGSFTYEVATNSHVADWVYEDQLTLASKGTPTGYTLTSANGEIEITTAKLVGTDPLADVAVLRFTSSYDLPVCSWGDETSLNVFDPVVSYGNSMGLDLRPAIGRVLAPEWGSSQALFPLLRVDPIITGGNSGGPVFALDGHVIGTTVQKLVPDEEQFQDGLLIPASAMKASVERILASETSSHPGSVAYGDWGMSVASIERLAREELLPREFASSAVQISKIEAGSPAERAGLKVGDLIVLVDGSDAAVRVTNDRHLYRFRSVELNSAPGETHELTVFRPGEWVGTYEITAREHLYGPVPTVSEAGLTVQDLTPDVREFYRIPDALRGVLILVDNSSSETGIGHQIVSGVNGVPVTDCASFAAAMQAAEANGHEAIVLTLVQGAMAYGPARGGVDGQFYVSLPKDDL